MSRQLFNIVNSRNQERIETNNRIKNFILFMASPIYVSNALKHGVLAYNGMKFTTGSSEFAAFSSFTSTISSTALNFYIIRKTIESVYDYCLHKKNTQILLLHTSLTLNMLFLWYR